MTEIQFTDRYEAMGQRPSPLTSCKGGCEAMGVFPMRYEEWVFVARNRPDDLPSICPQRDEDGNWEMFPPPDGWIIVYCPACGGSGRRIGGRLGRMLDRAYRVYYCAWFPFWAIRQTEEHGIRKLPWWCRSIWRDTRYWG